MDKEAVAERLRVLRHRQGLTQAGLAEAAGVGDRTYRNWESGRNAPRMGKSLVSLALLLRIEPGQLLYGMDYGKEFRDG